MHLLLESEDSLMDELDTTHPQRLGKSFSLWVLEDFVARSHEFCQIGLDLSWRNILSSSGPLLIFAFSERSATSALNSFILD